MLLQTSQEPLTAVRLGGPHPCCDCHVLDTGAHCCPCFSTLIPEPVHSLAINLCTSKFQRESETGCPADCFTGDPCCAERPVRGLIETYKSPSWRCTLVACASSFILLLAQARWRSMCDCDCNCCANHSVCSLVFVFCFFTAEGAPPHLLDLP